MQNFQFGGSCKVAGQPTLAIVEWLANLISLGNEKIIIFVLKQNIPNLLLTLMVKSYMNSIIHFNILRFFQELFTNFINNEIAIYFVESRIFEYISEIIENPFIYYKISSKSFSLPYKAHILRISEMIQNQSKLFPCINDSLNNFPKWKYIVLKEIDSLQFKKEISLKKHEKFNNKTVSEEENNKIQNILNKIPPFKVKTEAKVQRNNHDSLNQSISKKEKSFISDKPEDNLADRNKENSINHNIQIYIEKVFDYHYCEFSFWNENTREELSVDIFQDYITL